MPELPEVETVVSGLKTRLEGRRLCEPQVHQRTVIESDVKQFIRATSDTPVVDVRRRAKWILIDIGNEATVMVHLRMTGRFLFVNQREPLAKHDHVEWHVHDTDLQLRYNDVRRFGRMRLMATRDIESHLQQKGWGPEPFDMDAKDLSARMGRSSRPVKSALLDQSVVAGLGNIYADEILFSARIDPRTPTRRIGPERVRRIHSAMIETLERAIKAQGTSLRNYVSVNGSKGSFGNTLHVFRRHGEPCPRCGHVIRRVRLSGRSTHFCTRCQHH